jgi:hydrogenase maturation protease
MILIIAYGNSLRRDDGAGLRLGEILENIWRERKWCVERIAVHQLTPELALSVARDDVSAVVFTDARVVSKESKRSSPEILVQALPAAPQSPSLGHHLSPAAVMAYARLLYAKTPRAWIATVPGVDFDHGESLSTVALTALSFLPTASLKKGVGKANQRPPKNLLAHLRLLENEILALMADDRHGV